MRTAPITWTVCQLFWQQQDGLDTNGWCAVCGESNEFLARGLPSPMVPFISADLWL